MDRKAHEGFVIIDKPAGMTSHDVVAVVRRVLGTKRVGHGGTLDPPATGVLIVALGRATRLLRFVSALEKSYRAEIVLGTTTTTLDDEGELTGTFDMSNITLHDVRRAAAALTGEIEQVPPMVSAVKIGGKRLYELARRGMEIEREPRRIKVTRFDVEATTTTNIYAIAVDCSSGTYVRSLAADLGEALGGGAHLRSLCRIAVGPFVLGDATPLEGIGMKDIRSPGELVGHLARVVVTNNVRGDVAHGKVLARDVLTNSSASPLAVFDDRGELIAIYEAHDETRMKPSVVLLDPPGPKNATSARSDVQ